MTSLYNRADVYDLRFNQQGWDIFREHYRNIFAGTDIRTVLDCSIGSGNLTLELAELGYRVTGSDLNESMLSRCRERRRSAALRWSCSVQTFGKLTGLRRRDMTV